MKTLNLFRLALEAMPTFTISTLAVSGGVLLAQSAAPVRLALQPGAAAPIVVKTTPSAPCTLRPEGSNDPAHTLQVYADQAGVVRFYARPAGPSTARLELNCTSAGRTVMTPIELHAGATPSASMPEPVDIDPRSRSGASFVRPALQGDPMLLTAEELRRRRYPPRPDPKTSPQAYAAWLKAVTQPATFISPQAVKRPDRFHGPAKPRPESTSIQNGTAASDNWSGFVAPSEYAGKYYYVQGTWNVPGLGYEPSAFTASSEWIGLDGWNSNNPFWLDSSDVVQEGTAHDALDIWSPSGEWVVYWFYAWTEFYPDPERPIPNFQVSPSDQLYAAVDYNGRGIFWIENISAQTFITPDDLWPPTGTSFVGASAEWIMERPTINGGLPDLSLYVATVMCGVASANYLTGPGIVDAAANGNINVSMYNGPDLLSAAYQWGTDDQCIWFQWFNFH